MKNDITKILYDSISHDRFIVDNNTIVITKRGLFIASMTIYNDCISFRGAFDNEVLINYSDLNVGEFVKRIDSVVELTYKRKFSEHNQHRLNAAINNS